MKNTYLKDNEVSIIKSIAERRLAILKEDRKDDFTFRTIEEVDFDTKSCWSFFEQHFLTHATNAVLFYIKKLKKEEPLSKEEGFIFLFYQKMKDKNFDVYQIIKEIEATTLGSLIKESIASFEGKEVLFDYMIEIHHRGLTPVMFHQILNMQLEQIKILENKIVKTMDLFIQKDLINGF